MCSYLHPKTSGADLFEAVQTALARVASGIERFDGIGQEVDAGMSLLGCSSSSF